MTSNHRPEQTERSGATTHPDETTMTTPQAAGEHRQHLGARFAAVERAGPWRALRDALSPYPPPSLAGSTLNRMEQALVNAVADTLFPPEGEFPRSGSEAGMVEYFDQYLRRCQGAERPLLHLLLLFIELGPLAFGPRFARFTRLSEADRTRFLQAAFKSRIYLRRVAFTSLRALMTMGYLAHPEVARHIGIVVDPDPFNLGDSQEASP